MCLHPMLICSIINVPVKLLGIIVIKDKGLLLSRVKISREESKFMILMEGNVIQGFCSIMALLLKIMMLMNILSRSIIIRMIRCY